MFCICLYVLKYVLLHKQVYIQVFYLPLTLIFLYPILSEYTIVSPNIHNAHTFARTLPYPACD
jgi:hypothetical protein